MLERVTAKAKLALEGRLVGMGYTSGDFIDAAHPWMSQCWGPFGRYTAVVSSGGRDGVTF